MFEELQRELEKIQKGEIRSYYILYGDADYLLADTLARLQTVLLPYSDKDFGFVSFDCDTASEGDILDALQNEPLLPVRRVVVLKNFPFFKNKALTETNPQRFFDLLATAPLKAAREFCRFLSNAGFPVTTIKSGEWRFWEEHQWEEILGRAREDNKDKLPEALEQMAQIITKDDFLPPSLKINAGAAISAALPIQAPPLRTVIITTTDLDKSNKLFKSLETLAWTMHFVKPQREAQRKENFTLVAKEFLTKVNKRLAPAAWDVLSKKVGFELTEAMTALNKLVIYVGNKEEISAADVENAIGRTKNEAVFELSNALAKKDLKRALWLLEELLERGEHHQVLHAIIAREVRLLLHAKIIFDDAIAAGFRKGMSYSNFQQEVFPQIKAICKRYGEDLLITHPYTGYLALQNSQTFMKEQLVDFLEQLTKMDLMFKSSARLPHPLLERFIVNFCSSSHPSR